MKEVKEKEIIDILLKSPELLITMPLSKLSIILDMLERKNNELEEQINNAEKKLKIKK